MQRPATPLEVLRAPAGAPRHAESVLGLQRAIGNRAVGGMLQRKCACGKDGGECETCRQERESGVAERLGLSPAPVRPQPKLQINTPGDRFEQEADQVAAAVVVDGATSIPTGQADRKHNSAPGTINLQRLDAGSAGGSSRNTAPPIVHDVLQSTGQPLDPGTRDFMEPRFGHSFGDVRIHTDARAAESARSVNAVAYTVGRDVVFGAGRYAPGTGEGRRLLAHELAHVVQQSTTPGSHSLVVMRTPAEKVLKFAGKWLSKRTVKTVSKHIAKHARTIGDKAIHSVFRHPKKVKSMLESTVQEGVRLLTRHPKAGANEVIEGAGVRITRQVTKTPGKVRWVVERTFEKPIGTKGERILRMIIDQSGRIVTAFPAERLRSIGIGMAATAVLESDIANAAEQVRLETYKMAKREEERENSIDWMEFVPIIGDIYGGRLNEGEDDFLRMMDLGNEIVRDVIRDVEETEQRSLGPDERKDIEDLVRSAVSAPIVDEDEDSDQE